jgi:hypothetical protein
VYYMAENRLMTMKKAELVAYIQRYELERTEDVKRLTERTERAEADRETRKGQTLEALRLELKEVKAELSDETLERERLETALARLRENVWHPDHCHAAGIGQNASCTCGLEI